MHMIVFIYEQLCTGWNPPYSYKRREVVQMDTYEVLNLLFLGGTFLIALLTYVDRHNKRK